MKQLFLAITLTFLSIASFAQTGAEESGGMKSDAAARRGAAAAKAGNTEGTKRSLALSTNLFDWADMGTVNADVAVSVSKHFSLQAGAKFNDWQIERPGKTVSLVKNQQKSASLALRYWPWYVFSGWYVSLKGQYCQYSEAGIWRQAIDEGTAVGGGLSAGYSYMVGKHFNIEVGGGFWAGRLLDHTLWHCPECAASQPPRQSGPKNFIALNDITVSLIFLL